ncbi:hypothetical protein SLEP1_g44247 [Rubroshorea leprosula]|uniref:Uncharacterized protein n=2 Tax=Rubroshorea leprosula TaxID=152421 RepID=A0AAV5LGU4_9ROSI|nr:hypothetical protein SLEP1_g44247 [Rubroshorea leprosula]
MELTIGKSLLPIANKRSRSWQKSFQRRAMKKKRIIGARSSYASVPGGEKPVVHLPPLPRSMVLPSAVPGRGNSDQISPSPDANAHHISIEKKGAETMLAEARGSCSSVGKKRKLSRLQKAKEEFKRMKAAVKEKREETDQMQQQLMAETAKMEAAAERFESELAHGWAENELMMEQNLQDQHLLMLCWGYIS